jgi:hypothetical protein
MSNLHIRGNNSNLKFSSGGMGIDFGTNNQIQLDNNMNNFPNDNIEPLNLDFE